MRRVGLRADDKVKALNIRAHDLRHLHHAEVRHAQTRLALAHRVEGRLHGDVLDEQRHHAQHGRFFACHIRRDLRAHRLCVVAEPHRVVHKLADFVKRIRAEARVNFRIHVGSEVSQRVARKQPPQVDWNRHLHGLSAASSGNLFRLQVIDCLHHRRAQKLRHRDPVLLRAGLDLRDAEHHRDEIHIPVGLRRAA